MKVFSLHSTQSQRSTTRPAVTQPQRQKQRGEQKRQSELPIVRWRTHCAYLEATHILLSATPPTRDVRHSLIVLLHKSCGYIRRPSGDSCSVALALQRSNAPLYCTKGNPAIRFGGMRAHVAAFWAATISLLSALMQMKQASVCTRNAGAALPRLPFRLGQWQ